MSGRLGIDPLFQGLARPAMIGGVSYTFVALNMMLMMMTFINSGQELTSKLFAFVLGGFMHLFGYLLCRKEPRAVELWMLRLGYGFKSWNRVYHSNTNSYDVF